MFIFALEIRVSRLEVRASSPPHVLGTLVALKVLKTIAWGEAPSIQIPPHTQGLKARKRDTQHTPSPFEGFGIGVTTVLGAALAIARLPQADVLRPYGAISTSLAAINTPL